MGVPVITLSGDEHMSRVGTSIINNVGLSELIAKDQNDYIKIAATLAQDTGSHTSLQKQYSRPIARLPALPTRKIRCFSRAHT